MHTLVSDERSKEGFPVESEYDNNQPTSNRAEILLNPKESPSVVPPTGAEAFVEEKMLNFQYNRSASSQFKAITNDEPVKEGLATGWMLTLPSGVKFTTTQDEVSVDFSSVESLILTGHRCEFDNTTYWAIILQLPFTANLENRYSAYITEPSIWANQDHIDKANLDSVTIFPELVHLNEAPHFITVTTLVESGKTYDWRHGLPIAQIFPIHRGITKPDMEIHSLETDHLDS